MITPKQRRAALRAGIMAIRQEQRKYVVNANIYLAQPQSTPPIMKKHWEKYKELEDHAKILEALMKQEVMF